MGRVHMPKQNLDNLPTRNMKGLKKTVAEKKLERAKRTATKKQQKKGHREFVTGANSQTGPRQSTDPIMKLNTSRPSIASTMLNMASSS